MGCPMPREKRIGVSLSPYEQTLLAACVELCGYADQSAVLRSGGVVGARESLGRIAPERLAAIDRRYEVKP